MIDIDVSDDEAIAAETVGLSESDDMSDASTPIRCSSPKKRTQPFDTPICKPQKISLSPITRKVRKTSTKFQPLRNYKITVDNPFKPDPKEYSGKSPFYTKSLNYASSSKSKHSKRSSDHVNRVNDTDRKRYKSDDYYYEDKENDRYYGRYHRDEKRSYHSKKRNDYDGAEYKCDKRYKSHNYGY